MRSQKDLGVKLSKLKLFENPKVEFEQYPTPAHIAAEWIWSMAVNGEVAGKIFLDAACGTGIIGIGLLLLGAKQVFFLDKDKEAIQTCMDNYNTVEAEYEVGKAEFIVGDISLFDDQVDIVVQNPPFGTKVEHADKKFLEKAFESANVVYSMHKYSTKDFVNAITRDHNFKITNLWRFSFPIKSTFAFHEKPVRNVDVGLWRMEKT